MILNVKRLACYKGNKYLFRDLNFSVSPGQLLLIQGQNGSGKSSLLKILAGLSVPEKGKVYWGSDTIWKQRDKYCNQMSFLGHKEGMKRNLTPIENIRDLLIMAELPTHEEKMKQILAAVQLQAHAHYPCYQLSQGQRRKVALCALLVKQKPLWLLDEPFTALDKESIYHLQQRFIEHLRQNGMIVIASHTALDFIDLNDMITIVLG